MIMKYKNKYSADIISCCGLNNDNELMFTYGDGTFFSLTRQFITQYYQKV